MDVFSLLEKDHMLEMLARDKGVNVIVDRDTTTLF